MFREKRKARIGRAYEIDALESRVLLTNSAPGFNPPSVDIFFVAGINNSTTINASGSPAPSITEAGTLPTGVNFQDNHNGSATISGDPSASDAGARQIELFANNGVGNQATQFFSFEVIVSPTITSANKTSFAVSSGNTFMFTATGFPKADFTETGPLPQGVTFASDSDNPNSSFATLSGIPATGTEGTYPLTITATTENNDFFDLPVATQSFTLVVGRPPVFTNATSATFTVGTSNSFTFTTNASPLADLALSNLSLPSGLMFTNNNNGTATLSGMPAAGTEGMTILMVTADNGVPFGTSTALTLTIVDPPPAFTSANSATFTAGSQDVFPIGTTGPSDRSIDAGTALPTGITLTDNHDGTAVLSGSGAETPGTYPVTLEVGNGSGPDTEQMFTLTVNAQAASGGLFSSADHTTFLAGTQDSFAIMANGSVSHISADKLPSGITLIDNSDGTAALTASGAEAAGVYTFHLDVQGIADVGNGTQGFTDLGSQTFTLTVDQKPSITSGNFLRFLPGAAKAATFPITTVGFPAPTITETGQLPRGLSFAHQGSTGALIGGKTKSTGVFPITLTATNAFGSVTQTVMVVVGAKPSFTSPASANFSAGASGSFQITTGGFPLPKVTPTGALPPGLTIKPGKNGTATIGGRPKIAGTFPVTLAATSGDDTATQTLMLVIQGKPTFTSANNATLFAGQTPTFNIIASAVPAAKITVNGKITTKGPLPPGLSLHDKGNGTAMFAGTPTKDGTYHLVLTATNKFGSATEAITLTVVSQPAPSFVSAGMDTAEFNLPLHFTIKTGTGEDISNIAETGMLPAGVTFHDNRHGTATLSGTPANLSDGTYPLTFTATDVFGGTGSQSFTLTIVPLTFPVGEPDGTVTLRNLDGTIANRLPAFEGAIVETPSIAVADFNGDGIPDYVIARRSSVFSFVEVIDGQSGADILPVSPVFTNPAPITIATGDVNGDGTPDIIVGGTDGTNGVVMVIDGSTFRTISTTFVLTGYTGGVSVAAADFNGDGKADVVVSASGSGLPPQVQIFNGADLLIGKQTVISSAFAFDQVFTGGVVVATGDVNGDGQADIIAAPASPVIDQVRSVTVLYGHAPSNINVPFAAPFSASVLPAVSSADVNGDGFSDIIINGGAMVTVLSGKDGSTLAQFAS